MTKIDAIELPNLAKNWKIEQNLPTFDIFEIYHGKGTYHT